MKFLHNTGIGDWLFSARFLDPEEIDTIVWDAQCEPHLRPAIEACPEYAHIRHANLKDEPGDYRYSNTLRFHGVLHTRPYRPSAFIRQPLGTISHDLPERFVFIHPSTPFNTPTVRSYRDLRPTEWDTILEALDSKDLVGVVINSPNNDPRPKHPRLLDLTGKTSLTEAIEILKRAQAYWGIDSNFSILAAELFGPEDLWVRTRNDYLVVRAHAYYAPQTSFQWLVPAFGKAPFPSPVKQPILPNIVVIHIPMLIGSRVYSVGDLVDLDDERAERLGKLGHISYISHENIIDSLS